MQNIQKIFYAGEKHRKQNLTSYSESELKSNYWA